MSLIRVTFERKGERCEAFFDHAWEASLFARALREEGISSAISDIAPQPEEGDSES
jgi:hypothetical protein